MPLLWLLNPGPWGPPELGAQLAEVGPFRPQAEWRTLRLEGFDVHYPVDAEGWVLPLAARMRSIGEEVAELVGHAPGRRVTVLVTDPLNVSNGYAIPDLRHPLTVLWPTPPGPRIGEIGGWGEVLFSHEYAHLAHLAVPSRNPAERLLWRLTPLRPGPVLLRSPGWVTEGFATWIEGRLTGSARPHGVFRPAFLRVRALEGRLPTYGELSGAEGYQDGASPYLAGSAFVEWLVEREGEESLSHLWRRLSARERRSFSEAFRGVYGAPPDELYGRFATEVTGHALAARQILEEAGLEEGELWEVRRWHTGEPAISPDGSLLAVALHEPGRPARLVVRETAPDEEELRRRADERQRLVERDPLDVPAIDRDPPPRREVATLHPAGARAHLVPRFLPDGRRLLTVRQEPLPDGTLRPDLFLWDFGSGSLRRVTEGAGVREADPSPDGERAVGVRCEWGSCDLVLVDLSTGAVSVLSAGSPERVFHGPRWAPDGASVVASLQEEGRWRLVRVAVGDGRAGEPVPLDPDDGANRYDPAFLPDGRRLVAVSDLGGIANLEILDPGTGTVTPLTRVLGEVASPAPSATDGHVYFLSRHSRGWDVRRVHPDRVRLEEVVHLPSELVPAARRPPDRPPEPFREDPVPEPVPYRWGPQRLNLVPAGGIDAGGSAGHLALTVNDPVGRVGLVAQGALGSREAWTGGALAAVVRRLPVAIRGEAFAARRELDVRGGLVAVEGRRERSRGHLRFRLGTAGGAIGLRPPEEEERLSRTLAFAHGEASGAGDLGRLSLGRSLRVEGEAGRTGGEGWDRLRLDGALALLFLERGLVLRGGYGRLGGAVPLEEFRIGGGPSRLVDPAALGQVVEMPFLPPGLLAGDRLGSARVELRLGGLVPFYWVGTTDRDRNDRHRVVGVEQRAELPPLPSLGLPALSLGLGVGRSLDSPVQGRVRGWVSLGLRP
jgi:Tol biopolymer transport system component